MAEMSYSGLRFIDKDPATEAFRAAQKAGLEQDTGQQVLDERTAVAPSRLRTAVAGADLAETHARTAKDQAPYAGPQAQANLTGTNLSNTGKDLSNQYDNASMPSRLRMAAANTDLAESHADTAAAEVPYAAPMKAAGVRQAEATALNTSMANFYKSLEHLNAGRDQEADEIARQGGFVIPPAVKQDAELRGAVGSAAERAQKLYPNRPRDQQAYIFGQIKKFQELRSQGQRIGPADTYDMPEGAPTPPETSGTGNRFQAFPGEGTDENGKPVRGLTVFNRQDSTSEFRPGPTITSRAGGGARSGQTENIIAQLRQEDPSLTYADALALSKRAPNGDQTTLAKERLALNAAKGDANFQGKPEATLERYRLRYGLSPTPPEAMPQPAPAKPGWWDRTFGGGQPAPAPTPAPQPAPQRPDLMTPGDGGRPLNIQLPPQPPSVPPGSSYSPSRQMWRSPDGQVFDQNGQPVSQ